MNLQNLRCRAGHSWRKDIRPLVITALVLFSIRSSLADWNDVPSGSMKPTILEGDRIFVNKLAYDFKAPFTAWHIAQWSDPRRGDVVVFFSPLDGKRLVKRVIGLPGDVIEMRNEQLVINREPIEYAPLNRERSSQPSDWDRQHGTFADELLPSAPHAVMAIPGVHALRTFGPVRVPEGRYFMMGDNRDNSFDSRYFGCVERNRIVGRATSVVLSFDRDHHWQPRWSRFFSSLDRDP